MQNPFIHIQNILDQSNKEAAERNVSEVNIHHLMLGILNKGGKEVSDIFLKAFYLNPESIKCWLETKLTLDEDKEQTQGNAANAPHMDAKVSNVLRQAAKEALLCDKTQFIEPKHLLLAILKTADSDIANMLMRNGLTYDALKEYLVGKQHEDQASSTKDTAQTDNTHPMDLASETEEDDSQNIADNAEHIDEGNPSVGDNNQIPVEDEDKNLVDPEGQDIVLDEESNDSGDLIDPDEEPLDFSNNQNPQGSQYNSGNNKVGSKPTKTSKTPVIDKFGHDLTKAAAEGKLDPVVGRDKEIRRVMEILGRRKKNNPVLIGDPGVGKSAIVEGLAQMIADKKSAPLLFDKRVVSLDMAGMVAGTKYRGEFEARIKGLIKELETHPEIILFIDEIHQLVGAGGAEGAMDAANILKPALARGELQCIGATTLDEYRTSIEKDGALERRFQKVIVDATTAEETLQILHNIKGYYEKFHEVSYSDEALAECVRLTDRYVNDRNFPDKAIDVMDEVGSRVHLNNASVPQPILDLENLIQQTKDKKQAAVTNQNFEMAATYRDKQAYLEMKLDDERKKWLNKDSGYRVSISAEDITAVVSQMTGVPVQRMAEGEMERLKKIGERLKGEVIGQDAAVDKVVKAIQRNRIGLRDPNHPIGVFMFLGPTGVGKTYLTKKLAEEMFGDANAMIRIDMSEYSESFNTSRLIGAPPGYVGYNEGGQLTEKVRRRPYCIVLLDEIEKANPKVFNMLLQVLDEGRLTDGNGRLIDFRNTIVIMTSNAGTRQLKDFGRGIGFKPGFSGNVANMSEADKEYARSVVMKSLSKQFAPEFLNRLDEIITFDQLDLESIKSIVNLELKPLAKRIEQMGYKVNISDKAKEFVATKGYDVQYGARPLKRAIQTYVEDGICQLMMEGKVKSGDTISIGKSPNKDELNFRSI